MNHSHPNPLISLHIALQLSRAVATFSDQHPHLDDTLRQTYVVGALITLLTNTLGADSDSAREVLLDAVQQIINTHNGHPHTLN